MNNAEHAERVFLWCLIVCLTGACIGLVIGHYAQHKELKAMAQRYDEMNSQLSGRIDGVSDKVGANAKKFSDFQKHVMETESDLNQSMLRASKEILNLFTDIHVNDSFTEQALKDHQNAIRVLTSLHVRTMEQQRMFKQACDEENAKSTRELHDLKKICKETFMVVPPESRLR